MRYLVLACDYDGTLAHDGRMDQPTVEALERVRATGRKVLMVTGRELDDLIRVCPYLHLFDRIVAENGALLYDPTTREEEALAEAPPPEFVRELERRGVGPISVGRVIVATWEPHDATVLRVIQELGLELQVIFNKGAVMVLPSGVNKATGLRRALEVLKLSVHNMVGMGDAENDHAFLSACECGVAVANGLDSLKERVDLVTAADHGAGVVEVIEKLIASDLADASPRLARHDLRLGTAVSGEPVCLRSHDSVVLISGPSGAGKTTVTTALLEQLSAAGYQFCVVDPEGDYHEFPHAIALRGSDTRTLTDEAMRVLDRPGENVVVSLLDARLEDRPPMFSALLPRLVELRAAAARPHWLVIDEVHHLLPSTWQPSGALLPAQFSNVVYVTVHPDHVAPSVLAAVDTVILVGREAQATLDAFNRSRGETFARLPATADLDDKQLWLLRAGSPPIRFTGIEPTADRRRHQRKYAQGELGEDRSFYFRGPHGRLNLRAQNLDLFTQMADGVDDETWQHHLQTHDVSRWFRAAIKDDGLAEEAEAIEAKAGLSPADSRARIRAAIERRYTAPA